MLELPCIRRYWRALNIALVWRFVARLRDARARATRHAWQYILFRSYLTPKGPELLKQNYNLLMNIEDVLTDPILKEFLEEEVKKAVSPVLVCFKCIRGPH